MVRLRLAGGCLSSERVEAQLQEAARLHARGSKQAAADIYRDILRHSPEEAEAAFMLGVIAQEANNTSLAFSFYEGALRIKPDHAGAWFNRAVLLYKVGHWQGALESARMAIDVDTNLAEAWDLIGQIMKERLCYEEAAQCHVRAITLKPDNPTFYSNYAILLQAMNDKAGAYRALRQAEALDPDDPPLMLGNMLKALGYPEAAAALFAKFRRRNANDAEAAASEAMAYLQMGDMARGWPLWENRPDFETALHPLALWQGHKVDRLLLYEDQGLGDAIQFARYIPLLEARADHISLRIRNPLLPLFKENFTGIDILGEEDPLPPASARCRLSSLPFLCATTINTIPSSPYLLASESRRLAWRQKLRPLAAPRIGLVWAGNAHFHNDPARSLDVGALDPLLSRNIQHFVSLQKDRPQDQAAVQTSGVFDAAPLLADFADTAALIAELDLVIAADTATAHLAGALGKPVFILLAFDNDWRWLIGRADSPWYPSARLFRQKKPGDWTGVINALAQEIDCLIAGDFSVLRPAPWNGESLRQNPDAVPLPA